MAADVSAFTYFAPILAFLIVFIIMFALLRATKILGEEKFIQLFAAFIIATVFVTASSVRQVVLDVIPWFALLLIALFFILALAGFIGKKDMVGKPIGWVFIVLLIIVFLIAGVKVFSSTLAPYLPGPSFGAGGDADLLGFFGWLYSPRVAGAILLLGVAALVSWVLVKKGG